MLPSRFSRSSGRRACCASVLALLFSAPNATADSLAKRLPGQAVLFVEWSGSDALQTAAAATPLGRILEDPNVSKLVDQALRAIRIAVRNEAAKQNRADVADAAWEVLSTLWHRPVALDIVGVTMTDTGPAPLAVLAVDIGPDVADAIQFVQAFETLVTKTGQLPPAIPESINGYTFKRYQIPFAPTIRYGMVDGVFLIMVGADTPAKVLATLKGQGPTVSQDQRLAAAMKKIGTKGRTTCLRGHLDVQTLLTQARRLWQEMSQSDTLPPIVEGILQAGAIDRLRSITYALQIADRGYRQSVYVAMPKADARPKWMHQAPVTDTELAMVPADASFAKVTNFRLTDLYDGIMHVIAAIGPQATQPVNDALAQAEALMGLRIRQDILERLDDGWVLYDSPASGGLLITGLTLMVETKDPKALPPLLKRLATFIDKMVGPGVVTVEQMTHKNHVVHYASINGPPLPIAPAWTTHDRHLIIGAYPQIVTHAIDHLTAQGKSKSLLDNPDFARARKHLPPDGSLVVYADTKSAMTHLYRLLLPAAAIGCSAAQKQGVPINMGMLPNCNTLVQNLFGDVAGIKADDQGMMITYCGPLPITMAGPSIPTAAVVVSIAIPSFAKATERAKMLRNKNEKGLPSPPGS